MKTKRKKALSTLLALAMALVLLPIAAAPAQADEPRPGQTQISVGSFTIESPNCFQVTVNALGSPHGAFYSPTIVMRSYYGAEFSQLYQYKNSNLLISVTGEARRDPASSVTDPMDSAYWLTPAIMFDPAIPPAWVSQYGSIDNTDNVSSDSSSGGTGGLGDLFGGQPTYMATEDLIDNTTGALGPDGQPDVIIITGAAPGQPDIEVTLRVSIIYNSITGKVDMARYTVSAENKSTTQAKVYGLSWNVDTYSGKSDYAEFQGPGINKFNVGNLSVGFPCPNTLPWVGAVMPNTLTHPTAPNTGGYLFPGDINNYQNSIPGYLYGVDPTTGSDFVSIIYPQISSDPAYPGNRFEEADYFAMGRYSSIVTMNLQAKYYYKDFNGTGTHPQGDAGHFVRYDPQLLLPGQTRYYGVQYGQATVGLTQADWPWLSVNAPNLEPVINAGRAGYDTDVTMDVTYGYGVNGSANYSNAILRMTIDKSYLNPHSSMTTPANGWTLNSALSSGNTEVWDLAVGTLSPGMDTSALPPVQLTPTPVYIVSGPSFDGVLTPVEMELVIPGYTADVPSEIQWVDDARLARCDYPTLNGYVWYDVNGDGNFDLFEGLPGITVNLHNNSGLVNNAVSSENVGAVIGPSGIMAGDMQYLTVDLPIPPGSTYPEYAVKSITAKINGRDAGSMSQAEIDNLFDHFDLNGDYNGNRAFAYQLRQGFPVDIEYFIELARVAVMTYDPNGGSGTSVEDTTTAPGASYTVRDISDSLIGFTPPNGKQFKEWNTDPNGGTGGASYAPGATFPLTGDVTLYAIWEDIESAQTYTIGYTMGGGVNPPANPITYTAADLPLAIANPTRSGYIFAGWMAEYANGTTVGPEMNYSIPSGTVGDVALKATWTSAPPPSGGDGDGVSSYTVTFNSNGGSAVASQTVISGNKVTKPADPVREGYDFAGWFTDAALTASYDFTKNVTNSFTLYAKWTEIDTTPFKDVKPSDWFYDAAIDMYERGLMIGTEDDTFEPNTNLFRAMIVTILYRLEGEPDVTGLANPFDDVDESEWYTDAIRWAAKNGIVLGYGDGKFGANDPVTKEQLEALIYRTQQSIGKIPPDILTDFEWPDFDKVSDWAKSAVNALTIQGLFADIPGSNFNPQSPATRAVIASVLYRWLTAVE